jgi:DNA-binding transcriptional ArsR family regulator
MPWRALLSKEMADFLGVLAHPHRLRILHELRNSELDVNSMQELLGVSHSRVSQHMSTLRAHRIVLERREGRHVYYRLQDPGLAQWLLDGLKYIQMDAAHQSEIQEALKKSRQGWSNSSRHYSNGEDHSTGKSSGKHSPTVPPTDPEELM